MLGTNGRIILILEVTAVPFTKNHYGGGEVYPWRLVKALPADSKVLFVFSKLKDDTVEFDNIKLIESHFLQAPPFININNPLPTITGLVEIKHMLETSDLEFVHIHNLRTIFSTLWVLLAHLNKKSHKYKIILTDHTAKTFPFPKMTANLVDYYFPVSSFSGRMLNGLAKKPTFILPPIVPDELFSLRPAVKDIDILMVGRIVPWKRQDLGVEIINSIVKSGLADLKSVIVGSVGDQGYYNDLVSSVMRYSLQKNVKFIPGINSSGLYNLMSRSKVNMQFSLQTDMYGRKYREPVEISSSSILECAALGVPTVASNYEPFLELIDNEQDGLIVDPASVLSSSAIIRNLLEESEKIRKMGENARKRVMKNNSENVVRKKFLDYLDTLRTKVR